MPEVRANLLMLKYIRRSQRQLLPVEYPADKCNDESAAERLATEAARGDSAHATTEAKGPCPKAPEGIAGRGCGAALCEHGHLPPREQPPDRPARVEPLEWLREYVQAQLTTPSPAAKPAILHRVHCAASSQLHEYARRRFESLKQNARAEGAIAASTEDESVHVAMDIVRATTTVGVRQLNSVATPAPPMQKRAQCAHWFVAPDARGAFCSDRCKKIEQRPAARASTRVHRQAARVKARA